MDSLFSFPVGLFHPYNMPVVPKTPSSGRESRGIGDQYFKAKMSEATQVMVRTAKTAALTMLALSSAKRNSCGQHAVQDDEHLVGDRHNCAFWSSARSYSLEACLKH